MPSSYKKLPLTRRAVFDAVPGLLVTEMLFAGLRDQIFCLKNSRRQYISVNATFAERAGLSTVSAVLGRTASELFPPVLAAGYEQQDDEVFASGRAFGDRLEMITNPDGRTGWYLTQKQPIADRDGRVIALAAVSVDLHRPTAADPRFAALVGAIERIRRGYAGPLWIETLARDARLSLSQFERNVRSVFRISPRRLLTQTRVEAAAGMLRGTVVPLEQVGLDCGFYDQAQFCRQFRQATGVPPGRYRAAHEK